jgi:hypothetical protein
LFALSVPLHAVAAPQLAAALFARGFPAASAFLIAVLAPLGARRPNLAVLAATLLGLLAALFFAEDLLRAPLWIAPGLAQASAIALLALTVWRAYQLGLRRLLLALRAPLLAAREPK